MFLSAVKHKESEIPSSSLADIVFLLLIFFLVTTSIDFDRGIGLALPEWKAQEQKVKNITNVLINASGQVAIDGDAIQLNELTPQIKEKLFHHPGLIVSLKTDEQTDYRMYINVLDKLKQAWGEKPARISIAEPFDN
jgi:biopolymer transport protein ExbD